MGYQSKTVGGGPARGLANDFVNFLRPLITSGSFGSGTAGQQFNAANPMGNTAGLFGLLNSIISNPQADRSVQELIGKDIERGRNDLRARFGAGGGMAFGSPAAFAESLYQAEQAPRTAMAMDQMSQARLAALMPLLGMTRDISAMGIPQAQTAIEPKGWMQGINLLMDIANTAANFIPGGPGGSDVNSRASGGVVNTSKPSNTPAKGGYVPNIMDRPDYPPFNPLPLPYTQQIYR